MTVSKAFQGKHILFVIHHIHNILHGLVTAYLHVLTPVMWKKYEMPIFCMHEHKQTYASFALTFMTIWQRFATLISFFAQHRMHGVTHQSSKTISYQQC